MALLFPAAYQFLDSNGDPVGAGKLYCYQNGTTNAASTYSNPDLSTGALSSPIVLDSSGRLTTNVYVPDGTSFTVTLDTSSDAEVWSRDDTWGISNIAGQQTKYKTADQSVASATMADDNHLVDFSIVAGAVYVVEGSFVFDANATGGGIDVDLVLSQSPSEASYIRITGADGAGNIEATRDGVGVAATTFSYSFTTLTESGSPQFHVHGFIIANASSDGTLTARFANNTGTNTLTFLAGSWLRLTKIND